MNISSLPQQLSNNLYSSPDAQQVTREPLRSHVSAVGEIQSPQEKRQTALQLVDETLSRAYQKLSTRGLSGVEGYQAFEPLSAEKVANNILGFIERRLRLDQADGATQEELQARLDAGLSGFKKGFAEAEEKLKALDMLSPEVSADIGKTYTLVTEGIDKLREQLLGAGLPQAEPATSTSAVDTGSRLTAFAQLDAARARDFSFELTTREGDRVRINASASQSFGMAYNAAVSGGNSSVALESHYSTSQSFSLEIEGELSDEELGAINALLGKVNTLAEDFYAGDLEGAWNQALSLGFDQNQISEYSLSLTQVEVQVVEAAYSVVGTENSLPPSLIAAQGFMKSFLEALDLVSIFPEPLELLEQVVDGVDSLYEDQQGNHRFTDFIADRLEEMR